MICYTTYTTVVTGQATELAKMEPKNLQIRIYVLKMSEADQVAPYEASFQLNRRTKGFV